MEHNCKRANLEWEKEPVLKDDYILYRCKCPECGKKWEQVFAEAEGLWDVEKQEYNYNMM